MNEKRPKLEQKRKPTTSKYCRKAYQCTECGMEKEEWTNHYGQIYIYCSCCRKLTAWECNDPMPEDMERPPNWNIVKLGDVADIVEGKF